MKSLNSDESLELTKSYSGLGTHAGVKWESYFSHAQEISAVVWTQYSFADDLKRKRVMSP